eukprot:Rhum_TRINITY_DN23240_c0_g1::Rhum_TRINITY_DN23240_c0_g1_i1::g.177517::m.177517
MSHVRRLFAKQTRSRVEFDALTAALRDTTTRLGMTEGTHSSLPAECMISKYDVVRRNNGDASAAARMWCVVEGLERDLTYNVMAPTEKEAGSIMVEEPSLATLSSILIASNVYKKARKHFNLVFQLSFGNSDFSVSVGQLRSNGELVGVVVEVAYLPFSALHPPAFVTPLVAEFAEDLQLAAQGLAPVWEANAGLYARYGLPAMPDSTQVTVPYRHLAVDIISLVQQSAS